VTKERRLGRGLEALLGQIPAQQPALPAQYHRVPSPVDSPVAPQTNEESYGIAPHTRPAPPEDFFEYPSGQSSSTLNQPAEQAAGPAFAQTPQEATAIPGVHRVRIDQIDSNPGQPRQDFDANELKTLSDSISAHGLLQPVVVRRVNDRYQIIAGERRLRAAVQAGWIDVPVNIVEADDRKTAELAIIENLQRKDLNPLEKAASFQRYLEQYRCTQEELASRLNLDRSTIANLIRLLELPEPVQEALRRGEITQGHARALLPLGDEREQIEFCARIKHEGLNVRQTETLVQETIAAADQEHLSLVDNQGRTSKVSRGQNEHLAELEQQFRTALGLKKIQITHNAKGRGKLVIHFRDHEEFDRLREHICGGESDLRSQAG